MSFNIEEPPWRRVAQMILQKWELCTGLSNVELARNNCARLSLSMNVFQIPHLKLSVNSVKEKKYDEL